MKMRQFKVCILSTLMLCFGGMAQAALVHQYTFNEDGGASDSVGTADLTLNGTATVSDGSLNLPGGVVRTNNASATGDALTELGATINGSDAITIEAWVTQDVTQSWSKVFMAGQGSGDNFMDLTAVRANAAGVPGMTFNNGVGGQSVALVPDNQVLTNGVEHYIAAIWDEVGGSLTIYFAQTGDGGGPLFSGSAAVDFSSGGLEALVVNEFYLGSAVQFGDADFNGSINELNIYNTALSESEIQANINQGPLSGNVSNPSPANNAVNVPVTTDLSWDDPSLPNAADLTYDVYFGTMADPNCHLNPKVISNADVNAYVIPGDLDLDTTYYWQVDTLDPNLPNGPAEILASVCFSFTTVPPIPVITQQPTEQFPFAGESAVFTVAATSVSDGPFYQWYQAGDPDVLLTDETNATLTINPATTGDIGGYFCRVSNSGGTVDSDVAQLDIKRCLYHWPLDGDAIEANGSGFDGVLESSDPNNVVDLPAFAAGRVGQAISLDDTLEQQIRVAGLPISITGEMSFSCWVNPTNISKNFASILSKWPSPPSTDSERSLFVGQLDDDGGVRFGTYTNAEVAVDSVTDALADAEWTYLTGTHDGTEMRIYANGELRGVVAVDSAFNDRSGDLLMGNVPFGGTADLWFNGLIDDVQIYNYALTQAEIATAYNDVTGETVCVRDANSLTTSPLAPEDVNEDCIVNVMDFALVSQQYLQSALLP